MSLPSRRRLLLMLVAAELLLLYAPTLLWLWERWTMSVWQNAHGLMIPPLVAYLIRQEFEGERSRTLEASTPWGFALVVPALALLAIDAGMHTELLSAVSLLFVLPGLSLLVFGTARTRRVIIPLLFLVFALPIPLSLTEGLHMQLRQIVTACTAALLPWLGVATFAEGTTLHLANGAVEIADACSGFSTLYAAVAVASLLAYSVSSPMRRVALLAASVPIAIASNVARVVLLVALVANYGPGILQTVIHPLSGVMTFVLSLPPIIAMSGITREAKA